jgi:HAD superfamily phosphatase
MVKDLLIFDMDGVLVDVNASYRAAIQATVKNFANWEPTHDEIQEWKNRGGWNDDWKLSTRLIQEAGSNTPYDEVVEYFQKLFLGSGDQSLILREEWLANDGLFERLSEGHNLSVFTGRLRKEAYLTLDRFMPDRFHPVIGADDVTKSKPNPEGLHKICAALAHGKCWYVGDTVDDARASKAAQIPFVGIASKASPKRDDLVRLLKAEDAVAVVEDINSLEEVIAAHS